MSMHLVLRGNMVFLVTPTAVELSHCIGVLGCGHPIFMSAWHSGTISLPMVKRPASSASKADNMTFLMIVRNGPLWRGIGTSYERMRLDPARLRDSDTLK